MCLDLGSTVMKAALVEEGKPVRYAEADNPQAKTCADVMGRTQIADRLYDSTADGVNALIGRLTDCADRLVVTGNTVMLHLLLRIDPASMGTYPYTPRFTAAQRADGAALGLNARTVETLPCASAFIGADVTAGFADCVPNGQTALYIDLGTNGEIVLQRGTQLYCCSAAAGSAFGATATERIARVAERLKSGNLDKNGDVSTQSLQLAKAAIAAGVITLCDRAAVPFHAVEAVYLAGGLTVEAETARRIGLLPRDLPDAACVGNRSLAGAIRAATEPAFVHAVESAATRAVTVLPSLDPTFEKIFIRCIPLCPV